MRYLYVLSNYQRVFTPKYVHVTLCQVIDWNYHNEFEMTKR